MGTGPLKQGSCPHSLRTLLGSSAIAIGVPFGVPEHVTISRDFLGNRLDCRVIWLWLGRERFIRCGQNPVLHLYCAGYPLLLRRRISRTACLTAFSGNPPAQRAASLLGMNE